MIGSTGGYAIPHPDSIRTRTEAERYARDEYGVPSLAWIRVLNRAREDHGPGLLARLAAAFRPKSARLPSLASRGHALTGPARIGPHAISRELTTTAIVLPALATASVRIRPKA